MTEHTAVTPPAHTQTGVMEPRPLQAYTQMSLTVPACIAYHMPQLYDASSALWLDAPGTASSLLDYSALLPQSTQPAGLDKQLLPLMMFEPKPFTPITAQPWLPSSCLKDTY